MRENLSWMRIQNSTSWTEWSSTAGWLLLRLSLDKYPNPDGVSSDTIERLLNRVELYAYRPAVIPEINDVNKEKWFNFCLWTKKCKIIVFSDESWICAEAFHLQYVRHFHGETLSEELSLKKTRFKGRKKLFVWAAISFDGPEYLYFIEGKENTDA